MINNGLMLYYGTSNSILINDFVDAGILLSFSSENRVSQNNLNGIWLEWGCNYNELLENNITNSIYGIYLEKSDYNRISGNRITNCSSIGIYVTRSSDNIISNNNFINNAKHAYSSGSTNIWDDGYPSGGNYWSDYAGVDFYRGPYQNETGSDGLGDTSYVIDVNNRDNYPLMAPLNTFEAQHWDGITYNFHVISNSTILNFELFESLIPEIPSTISLNVSGPDNTRGFCRITIPNIIVQDLWKGSYIVLLNGQPWPFSNWTDTTNTYVYINYTHSTHEIIIIPEFPSITTIFMVATLTLTATIILKAKRKRQSPKFFPI
jgi:parallel beta-helix repeat protein